MAYETVVVSEFPYLRLRIYYPQKQITLKQTAQYNYT
jgi:hypothetical protein